MYIDDSSMIFVFLLHMFLVNNFQCEIVQWQQLDFYC
jgi:hypothetical protein